jgi:predicted GNAT family acetyltransferase
LRDDTAMQMIEHEQSGHRGAFFVEEEGKRVAQLTYTVAGTKVILDHTEIDDTLRGTGTGRKLVAAAVDWAREENVRLLPLCPFARSVFDKTPEFSDVLAR